MFNTLRAIFPRRLGWMGMTILAVVVLLIAATECYIAFVGGLGLHEVYMDILDKLFQMFTVARDVLLLIIAAWYAGYRNYRFSPWLNSDYGRWLSTTPWRGDQSLPFGPFILTVWDVIVVVILTLLLSRPSTFNPLWLPTAFMAISLLFTIFAVPEIDGRFGWWFPVLLPLVWFPHYEIVIALVVLVIMYVATVIHFLRQTKVAPWEHFVSKANEWTRRKLQDQLPWYIQALAPGEMRPPSLRGSILIGLFTGWWLYVISDLLILIWFSPLLEDAQEDAQATYKILWLCWSLCALIISGVVSVRSLSRNYSTTPPLRFLARLSMFQIWIARYDWQAIPFFVCLPIAASGPFALHVLGLSYQLGCALTIALLVPVGVMCPPTTIRWTYTGQFSYMPLKSKGPQKETKARNLSEMQVDLDVRRLWEMQKEI